MKARQGEADSTAEERREFPRRGSGCVVVVRPLRGENPANAQRVAWLLHSSRTKGELIDVSMNGVAFLLSEPIEKEETLLLRLANCTLDKQVDVLATVVRTASQGHGKWKIVCKFDRNLTFDQVHTLGHHLFPSRYV